MLLHPIYRPFPRQHGSLLIEVLLVTFVVAWLFLLVNSHWVKQMLGIQGVVGRLGALVQVRSVLEGVGNGVRIEAGRAVAVQRPVVVQVKHEGTEKVFPVPMRLVTVANAEKGTTLTTLESP